MWKLIYSAVFLLSFLLSNILVSFARRIALRLNFLDNPDLERKIHAQPTPLLGGAGMYVSFLLTIIFSLITAFCLHKYGLLSKEIVIHLAGIKTRLPQITAILSTSLLLIIVGLIDDLKRLSAKTKLLFQIAAAGIVFLAGIRITLFIPNTYISALITICWIIGITNAFNLLDNMDGLSCGTAIISSGIFFIIASSTGHYFVAVILACFIGVLLGFLRYNFPPAKIFMGDAGSLFIGYMLSILTIINTYYTKSGPTPAAVIMPLIILAVPIFDTLSVIYIRLKKGNSIFTADKNHFSHRLVNLGMSKKNAVLFIYLVNFCIGLAALLLHSLNLKGCLIILGQTACILTIIVLLETVKKCSD